MGLGGWMRDTVDPDFASFVDARQGRWLRTAYLVYGDLERAEAGLDQAGRRRFGDDAAEGEGGLRGLDIDDRRARIERQVAIEREAVRAAEEEVVPRHREVVRDGIRGGG